MSTEDMTKIPEQSFPFEHSRIPVCNGLDDYIAFAEQYPGFIFCPYLADKDDEAWKKSTSRVYMNQALPNFLYVPVNIPKDDADQLTAFITHANQDGRIAAVNITQPHKSSPALRRFFFGDENAVNNVDTLIKDELGRLQPYDLNAPAFVGWFNDSVAPFSDKPVVLIGVGGVGEPIAKLVTAQQPKSLILIDPSDKSALAEQLGDHARYLSSLDSLDGVNLEDNAVVINASGKDGVSNDTGIQAFLEANASSDKIFVDIRPHLDIPVVEQAQALGWQAHTGHGMNARNDYELLGGIARYIGVEKPSFGTFEHMVAAAS